MPSSALSHRMGSTQKNDLYGSTRSFWNYCKSQMFNSKGPEKSFEKTFRKKVVFLVKKCFGLVLLVLSSMTNASEKFIRLRNVYWQLFWKLWDLFCNTQVVVENTNFWEPGYSGSEKKFDPLLSYYRTWRTSRKSLPSFGRYLDIYWWSCEILRSEPKRLLKTIFFEKKSLLPVKKQFGRFLSYYQVSKPLEPTYKGP